MPRPTRRDFLKLAGLGAAALALPELAHTASPSSTNAKRPNIIFFIADDMNADMFNWRPEGKGNNLSPNLDRLAAESTILWGQHIVSPVCTPSRFNCLSGRFASRAINPAFQNLTRRAGMTCITWNSQLTPGEQTLPGLLRQAGYATGIVGKTHCLAWSPAQPVLKTDDPRKPEIARRLKRNQEKLVQAARGIGFDFGASLYPGNCDDYGPAKIAVHNMDWITQGSLDFIDQAGDKPFFLYFAPTLTHSPYQPVRAWASDPLATPAGYLEKPLGVLPPRETIPQRLKAAGLEATGKRGMVLWMDDALGALLRKLEERKLLGNTIIVFFNDNGQEGKGSIYQSATHAPSLFWRRGGFACGHENHTWVTNLDFAPTLLELAGAPLPAAGLDGKSFKPVLDGKPATLHEALYFELGFTRGVLKGDWKYIALRYPPNAASLFPKARNLPHMQGVKLSPGNPPFGHIGGNDNERAALRTQPAYFDNDQLYDLSKDPKEQKNLAADPAYAARLAEMKRELQKHLDKLPGGFAELKKAGS